MNTLNFASYGRAIKKGMPASTNTEVTRLLLELIINNENVLNKMGEPYHISNYHVSKWWNRHEDIPSTIKKSAASLEIRSKSTSYFEDKVINALSYDKELDAYCALADLISCDKNISNPMKDALLNLYNDKEFGEFLSETFLYAIQKSNKNSSKEEPCKKSYSSSLRDSINKLNNMLEQFPKPRKIIPQDILHSDENIYTSQLLASYADEEGVVEISLDNLSKYPKYKKNFERQRKYYYAAESIRRCARDTFGTNEDYEFNLLKDETYEGIIDVYEHKYSSGFQRLNNVMNHVTTVSLNKSWLTKMPGWVGSSEKKGLCHMLVNEGLIKWVDDYE